MKKLELSYTIDGNGKWCTHFQKVLSHLEKLNLNLLCDPAIQLIGIYLLKRNANTCPHRLIYELSLLFMIVKKWKQSKCPWLNKTRRTAYIRTIKYCSNKKEPPIQVTTWMHFKNIKLGEKSQNQKTTYYQNSSNMKKNNSNTLITILKI